MANIEVLLPQMGEGVIEATITRWLVELNNAVTEDEPIVEIATDKVDSEIPAPASGTLVKQFFSVGEIPKVGEVIAIIKTNGKYTSSDEVSLSSEIKPGSLPKEIFHDNFHYQSPGLQEGVSKTGPEKPLISPFIRHYASQRGIRYEELLSLKGSDSKEEPTREDVLNYFKASKPLGIQDSFSNINLSSLKPMKEEYILNEGEEMIELDRTRKIIAERMQKSLQLAPHVTSFVEADVTHLVKWREINKKQFLLDYGVSLTYTPIIAEIATRALKEFPGINVSLAGDFLIKKKYINIGIATALPDGNLIVPVIKGTDKLNLVKLAIEIHDVAARARNGKLAPGESSGGTFTITNLGQYGNTTGTPIINQPESAILAVGAIKKRAWVVEVNETNTIGIRDVITLALSYDHRIIDGALGGAFLSRIGQLLESHTPGL